MTNEFSFKNSGIVSKGLAIYNARSKPFQLYGLYNPQEPGVFKRIPFDVAEKTSKNVKILHTNTAGARLRFKTDSSYIAVGAIYPKMEFPSPCSTALSSAGGYSFDLYADNKFRRVLWPKDIVQNGSINNFVIRDGQYEGSYDFGEKKMREITLCFPSFVDISDVYIGLTEGSVVEESSDYVNEKPVVFYGSSITHGACASRPGNTYENILSRRLNMDYPEQSGKVATQLPYDVIVGATHAVRCRAAEDIPIKEKWFSKINYLELPEDQFDDLMRNYLDDMLTMVETQNIDIMAHILCTSGYYVFRHNIYKDMRPYEKQITKILEACIRKGIAMEMSRQLFWEYEGEYPYYWIAEKYYELGGYLITLSTDAHNPQAVGEGHGQKIAMLKQTGFTHMFYYKDRKAVPCSLE